MVAVGARWRCSASGWRYELYIKQPGSSRGTSPRRFSGVYTLLYNKYYVDQIYDAMFVNRTKDLATGAGRV